MPNKNTKENRGQKWVNIMAIILVIAAIFVIGYLIVKKFSGPSKTPLVEINVPLVGATVYIDGNSVQTTDGANQNVDIKDLAPTTHTVIVAKEGFWPWTKPFDLSKGSVHFRPFLIAKIPKIEVLASSDPDYSQAVQLLASSGLPLVTSMGTSSEQNVDIWVQENKIMAKWVSATDPDPDLFFCRGGNCSKMIQVVASQTPINRAFFYQKRSDVILFSTEDSIYAVELNNDGTQNFQPVYMGKSPIFAPSRDGKNLYIKDNGSVFRLTW